MPNPLFLQVMGVSLHEYNAYSPAKKERFQKAAQQRLAEVHESDIDAYCKLTEDAVLAANDNAEKSAADAAADKEFS